MTAGSINDGRKPSCARGKPTTIKRLLADLSTLYLTLLSKPIIFFFFAFIYYWFQTKLFHRTWRPSPSSASSLFPAPGGASLTTQQSCTLQTQGKHKCIIMILGFHGISFPENGNRGDFIDKSFLFHHILQAVCTHSCTFLASPQCFIFVCH